MPSRTFRVVFMTVVAMAGLVGAPAPAAADKYGVNGIAEVGTASSDSTSGIVAASANGGCAQGNVAVQQGGNNGGCYYEANGWEAGVAIGNGAAHGFLAAATEGNADGTCEWF